MSFPPFPISRVGFPPFPISAAGFPVISLYFRYWSVGIAIISRYFRRFRYSGRKIGRNRAQRDPLDAVVSAVLERVLEGEREWLALLTGEDAPALDGLLDELGRSRPDLTVEVHEGGQPHYPLLVVAE